MSSSMLLIMLMCCLPRLLVLEFSSYKKEKTYTVVICIVSCWTNRMFLYDAPHTCSSVFVARVGSYSL
jgi:hypothetical protein